MQDVQDIAEHSMRLLRHISPHFDGLTFIEIVKIEPVPTVLELLKAAGDAEEVRKSHVSSAASPGTQVLLTVRIDTERTAIDGQHVHDNNRQR